MADLLDGRRSSLLKWMLAGCGVWLFILGLYFIFIRPPLLPEDLRFMDKSLPEVHLSLPRLEPWLARVFTVMGGFISGAGVLIMFVALKVVPLRPRGTFFAISLSGLFTVGLMCVVNFSLHSDFRFLLLLPALAWVVSIVLYTVGR